MSKKTRHPNTPSVVTEQDKGRCAQAPGSVSVAWHDAMQELPDSDTTVLIHCPIANDPVWMGYHDGETWRQVDGEVVDANFVDHWAQIPEPPPLPWHTSPNTELTDRRGAGLVK